ncbi:PaaI family thioesterase [Celeribacter litoreus]|uniref:PaaI family thioesterase n=1 Tax=Celeribacter litoreus TaxID=2876714 RepID=UPI001CC99338|nr:PaaI family thioesterase [Celeribacter litoreus]MCA0042867.1 PaaI family thioesterase [Celeribacter litoreus]
MTADLENKTERARTFVETLPHCQALGMALQSIGQGEAEIAMPYAEKLIGDPDTGVIHGGAVSALMDTCAGAAVMSHPEAGYATATLDLRIDYMRAAKPGATITAHAICYHMTRSVAFVRVSAHDGSSDVPVAAASGAFAVERGSK